MNQPTFNFNPDDKIEADFLEWLAGDFGRAMKRKVTQRALKLKRAGWNKYGIAGIWEPLRYEAAKHGTEGADKFKMNNNHKSRLARHIESVTPELKGFFTKRETNKEQLERAAGENPGYTENESIRTA